MLRGTSISDYEFKRRSNLQRRHRISAAFFAVILLAMQPLAAVAQQSASPAAAPDTAVPAAPRLCKNL